MRRSLRYGLTDEDIARRRFSIGGSDANIIGGNDQAAISRLWSVKTGRVAPPDLSGVLAVAMGTWTEELNRYWFERQTGLPVSRAGERLTHPEFDWLTATLDGAVNVEGTDVIYEAKHVSVKSYSPTGTLRRYMPQLQHNMFVAGFQRAVLSVFVGSSEWREHWIDFDPFYHASLLIREMRFWQAVQNDRLPVAA